jgi:hypothetical protein
LKTLIDKNSKNCSKSRIKFLFRLSLSLVDFSQCIFAGRPYEQFSGSQAAFGTSFRLTGGYRKAGTSFPEKGYWKDFHN